MFVGDEVELKVSFAVARERLMQLAGSGLLLSTSEDAYDLGTAGLARVGIPGLSKLVRVQAHDLAVTPETVGLAIRWEATGPAGELFPVLRRFGADAPGVVARRFNQVAWTAFGVLIVTGIWNIVAVRSQIDHSASYRTTLIVKLAVVAVSGVAAALHIRSRTARSRAVFGALTGLSALAALFLGVLLAG